MREVLISNPPISPEQSDHRKWSYIHQDLYRELDNYISELNITPDSHPRVADIAAGDGAVAYYFLTNGWKPQNISCVDRYVSPTPLVSDVVWTYIDLDMLYYTMRSGDPLPEKVERLRDKHDIVVEYLGGLFRNKTPTISRFFAKPGGFIYISGYKRISK